MLKKHRINKNNGIFKIFQQKTASIKSKKTSQKKSVEKNVGKKIHRHMATEKYYMDGTEGGNMSMSDFS